MATKLIKKAAIVEKQFHVGQLLRFPIQVALQNIGTTDEWHEGKVVKVNKVTIDIEHENGNVYRVDKWDLRNQI